MAGKRKGPTEFPFTMTRFEPLKRNPFKTRSFDSYYKTQEEAIELAIKFRNKFGWLTTVYDRQNKKLIKF